MIIKVNECPPVISTLQMNIVNVSGDILQQIMEMLHLHEASFLGKTCSRLQDIFKGARLLDNHASVYFKENKLLVTRLSGSFPRWREKTNNWVDMSEALKHISGKKIETLAIKKTRLTADYCMKLSELLRKSQVQVIRLDVKSCVLPRTSTLVFGDLLSTIGAKAVYINKIPRIGTIMYKIIPFCEEKADTLSFHYWGKLRLTLRQDYFINLRANHPGRLKGKHRWNNPALVNSNESNRKEYKQCLQELQYFNINLDRNLMQYYHLGRRRSRKVRKTPWERCNYMGINNVREPRIFYRRFKSYKR